MRLAVLYLVCYVVFMESKRPSCLTLALFVVYSPLFIGVGVCCVGWGGVRVHAEFSWPVCV